MRMKLYEYYHNHPPTIVHYVQRKLELPDEECINLYGVRGAGKSAYIFNILAQMDQESFLYIDCEDPNLAFDSLDTHSLEEYISQNDLRLLILDHYHTTALERLPHIRKMITITRIPLALDNFTAVELFPLDYEEFLVFEKAVSASNSFNSFIKLGTLPILSKVSSANSAELKTFMQSKFDPQEQRLFIILSLYQTHHLTRHQLYTQAKERFKISKDWLYRKIKEFEEEGVLYFIDDHYQRAGKKLILFDFILSKYCTLDQPFSSKFDTIIALALIKHKVDIETLGIHGYLTKQNELIIPAPFESEESMWKKSHEKFSLYKTQQITQVTIVTVGNNYNYSIEEISFEAMPFYEWSILFE